jgi:hypothetical protein
MSAGEQENGPDPGGEQPSAGPVSPGWTCSCGRSLHPFDPGRCAAGHPIPGNDLGKPTRFQPENWAAATSTLRSDRWPAELEVLRAEVESFLTATLADEADPDDVPARRKALLGYRARLHRRIVQLDAMLELRGLVDRRGKLRTQWLQQLAGLIERARQLDVTLGLARRSKPVPSLAEYLEQRQRDDGDGDPADEKPTCEANDEGSAHE